MTTNTPAQLQIKIELRNGAHLYSHMPDLAEDASDEEITDAIRDLLTTHAQGGWIALGDLVVHVQAIEAITPR